MLSFNKLTFIINEKVLFNNINITFLSSSIVYLQGQNGSGKTSLLRMVANIQKPTKGEIIYRFFNCTDLKKPYYNYISHNLGLKTQMSVLEHLEFWAKIYNSCEALEASIYYFKLYNILDKKIYQLSAGNQKKIALAKLVACQSNLWLLDEVESSLDHDTKYLLHNLIISKANNGGIILIASHNNIEIKSAQILNLEDYNNPSN